jgi:signal transduction histidine kinase
MNDYIDHIERSVKKLEDVIINMIQYSRNSSLVVKHEKVNLYDLIQACLADIKFLPGMETMNFELALDKDTIVMSDPSRLLIILNNLIGNSVKYRDVRKNSNYVRIIFQKDETVWKLEIYDNGIGIDKKYISRVFEMFYRATGLSQGSGLGLYIVKETVERLGGKVFVDSEKDEWTKFTIAIPH